MGVHPEPRRGVDLDDGPTRLAHRLGDVGREEVDAGDVQAHDARRLFGDLHVVLVRVPGAVDRDAPRRHVAGGGQQYLFALGRDVFEREPLLLHQVARGIVDLDAGQHLLVADATAWILVGLLHQLGDRALAVAGDVGRDPLRDRHHVPADHQHAIVVAGDVGLHHHLTAARFGHGPLEPAAYGALGAQIQPHPAAVVAVQRLGHHGEPDPLGGHDGIVLGAHHLAARDRQPGRGQQAVRHLLVAGDVHGERTRLGGHRGADPLLVGPLAQLDQGVFVQPDPRDVAGDGFVDDRLRRRAELPAFGEQDQALPARLRSRTRLRP